MRVSHQVVEILLAETDKASSTAKLLSANDAWTGILNLAETWRVTPNLHARIEALSVDLPPADTVKLRRDVLRNYAQCALRASDAVKATQALEQAGIPVAVFKGVASLAYLYGGPRHRTVHDGDLLILAKDLSKALPCLDACGFSRNDPGPLDEYLHFVAHSPAFAGNRAITLHAANGNEIDLHWEVKGSGLRTEQILDRARRAELLGVSIPVADPVDCFLLNIHHAIRENLAIESVIRDLLDVQLWCRQFEEAGQFQAALERTAESGALVAALAVTSLLRGYNHESPAARCASFFEHRAKPVQRRSAARLTELFHYQLREGRVSKDVFYLVHPKPWGQILRGLGTGWSGYRRHMRMIERHVGVEVPLRRRAAQLAQSLPGPRALRLARELARVKFGTN